MHYYSQYDPCVFQVDELICFSSMLLRWPYNPIGKLSCRMGGRDFFLYEINGMYKNANGSLVAKMIKHEKSYNKFEYYIDNYEHLFFLKKEVEFAEDNDPMLVLEPINFPLDEIDTVCTKDNIGTIAAKTINSICLLEEYSNIDKEEFDTFRIDGKIHYGTRGRDIPPDRLWPKIPHLQNEVQINLNKKQLHEKASEYIAILRSVGQNNMVIIARETKKAYPKLNDSTLGRLISPSGEDKRSIHTYRQRARRALGKVP